jgi:PAS domain S-box-containing protein
VLVFVLGLLLSIAAFAATRRSEERRRESEFKELAGRPTAAVQESVGLCLEEIQSIGRFYAASHLVERGEFRDFVQGILSRRQAVDTLVWAPRVGKADRSVFEAAARRELSRGFQIFELDEEGHQVAAGRRDTYYPVWYVEPPEDSGMALGFDLASSPVYLQGLRKARDLGAMAATQPLALARDGRSQPGVAVMLPIYGRDIPRSEETGRRGVQPSGFVVGKLRIADLVDEALEKARADGIQVCLYDRDGGPTRGFLYSRTHLTQEMEQDGAVEGERAFPEGPSYVAELEIADRAWLMECAPAAEYLSSARSWEPWAVLAVGVLFTSLLTAYVATILGRAAWANQLVAERTAELSRTNEQLRNEMAERTRTERALLESEQRFRALTESTSDWIWEVDAHGVYTYASPKVQDLLGYTPEEVLGRTPFDLMPPEEAERVSAEFGVIAASRKPFAGLENTNLRKDGRRVVLESSGVPVLDGDGELRGYRGIDRDITARKQAEEALQATNRELESFVHMASHDLRTPLVSIEGFAKLLAEDYGDRLDAEGQDYLRRVRVNATAMESLLTDLLELSRVTRTEEPRETVPVAEIVAQVLEDLGQPISESGAHIAVLGDLPTVCASPTRLRQVLSNLISNAIKFSREGVVPRVEIAWEKLGESYRFSVRDNGIGIEAQFREQVFDLFTRLKEKDVAGTGVGLAIVKRIVEDHGGTVGVDSRIGQGSTFWFTLPQAESARQGR